MKYMGSKNRIAKHILPIILKDRKEGQWYVEPFVGGANIIDKVDGNRIGADNNKYLIAMLDGLKGNCFREFDKSKAHYALVRDEYNNGTNINFTDFYIGYVGFMASANGRFFEGGYSGKSKTKIGTVRDYIGESIRGIEKQIPKLKGIEFICSDYFNLKLPRKSIIYCDIPYKGTKQYAFSKGFKHFAFWQWCREKSAEGHQVFVSEYAAPDDFVCVWEQEVKSSLSASGKSGGNKKSIEKLFVHESQL
jgi:DNA adenine methylase